MASTRNKNTNGNYVVEQRMNMVTQRYNTNPFYGETYADAIPSIGITPSHMPRDSLSHNPIDTESMLFGINSTNLVNPRSQPKSIPKKIPEKAFFERLPLIMPTPLVIEDKQRPLPMA